MAGCRTVSMLLISLVNIIKAFWSMPVFSIIFIATRSVYEWTKTSICIRYRSSHFSRHYRSMPSGKQAESKKFLNWQKCVSGIKEWKRCGRSFIIGDKLRLPWANWWKANLTREKLPVPSSPRNLYNPIRLPSVTSRWNRSSSVMAVTNFNIMCKLSYDRSLLIIVMRGTVIVWLASKKNRFCYLFVTARSGLDL